MIRICPDRLTVFTDKELLARQPAGPDWRENNTQEPRRFSLLPRSVVTSRGGEASTRGVKGRSFLSRPLLG